MINMSVYEVLNAVNGINLNKQIDDLDNLMINNISIDSRNITSNSLYIPIKGDRFDGHSFIYESFNKGALVCLTQENIKPKGNEILIYVEDTKKALMELAKYYRGKFNIPVIAITGSVGKTSTKDLIAATLSAKYNVHKTQGNFNNEIGLPLTIFGLEDYHEVLVLEMGMNHFGEIHNLTNIAKPDIAVITNIGTSHIENLGSQKGILKAKCEILDGMDDDGILIINGDDDLLNNVVCKQEIIKCGINKENDYIAYNIQTINKEFISANIDFDNLTLSVKIKALGEHMIKNALVAVAVAKHLSLSQIEIQEGLELYKSDDMRMNLQKTKSNIYVINDTYNASPDSMEAAIDVVSNIPDVKRKILILGDMFEMGVHSEQLHQRVGKYIAKKNSIDLLITVGKLSLDIQKGAIENGYNKSQTIHYDNQEDLIKKVKSLFKEEDLILVKASRGMKLENTVEEIRKVNIDE